MTPTSDSSDGRYDGIAALLSSLCLWHCLVLPLALGVVPVLLPVASLMHGPAWLHWLLIVVAAPASGWALWRGLQGHRDFRPVAMAVLGFALMVAGAMAHRHGVAEQFLTVAGGLVVAAAHWRNWQMLRQSAIG